MAKVRELDLSQWEPWVKTRPFVVRDLCERFPPDRLYLLKSSGHRVTVYSYSEDGTMTVNVTGEYNALTFERRVFGISPSDLEECDLPASDEPIGTLLTEREDVEDFLKDRIEEMHRKGERHNEANCRICSGSDASDHT